MHSFTLRSEHFADPELDQKADVPDHYESPIPPGVAFAAALASGIEGTLALGEPLELGEFPWTTYSGHAFEVQRADVRFDVIVSLQDREAGTWTLTAEVRRKLMSWKKKDSVAGLDALVQALKQWLEQSPHIHDVAMSEDA